MLARSKLGNANGRGFTTTMCYVYESFGCSEGTRESGMKRPQGPPLTFLTTSQTRWVRNNAMLLAILLALLSQLCFSARAEPAQPIPSPIPAIGLSPLAQQAAGYPASLDTQQVSQQVTFQQLRQSDGLSQNSVMSIAQDQLGFIWLGTEDGLNRFDGFDVRIYKPGPDPNSLSDNLVRVLHRDRQGNLWVGTEQGLNRYRPESDDFQRYLSDSADPHSLSDDSIRALHSDQSHLWIGTRSGLDRLNLSSGNIERFIIRNDAGEPVGVRTLFTDRRGRLWAGTWGDGLRLRTEDESWQKVRWPASVANAHALKVIAMAEDAHGRLWIGTFGGGALIYDPDINRWRALYDVYPQTRKFALQHIRSLTIDGSGDVWIGANDSNLIRIDIGVAQAKQWIPRSVDIDAPATVIALFEDDQGLLWLGTQTLGAMWRNPKALRFEVLTAQDLGLRYDSVFSLMQDRQNRIWLGTEADGVRPLHLSSPDQHLLPGRTVFSQAQTVNGDYWFGSDAGLHRWRPGEGMHHFEHRADDPGSISDGSVQAILEDVNGLLWVGTHGYGISVLVPETSKFNRLTHDPADPYSLPDNRVRAIVERNPQQLWVATFGGGLALLDKRDNRFYPVLNAQLNQGHDYVLTLHQASDDVLWVGTNGGGLYRYDGKTKEWRHFGELLPNDVVYSIQSDNGGNLWLSTNLGLVRFTTADQSIKHYRASDGLPSNEFNANAGLFTRQGQMLFASTQGLVAFDPANVWLDELPPRVIFTNLLLANKPVHFSGDAPQDEPAARLKKPIAVADRVTLFPGDNQFALEFSALHFVKPEKLRFAYRLSGIDNDWIYTDAGHRRATYTQLPPGDYQLRVIAANEDRVWSKRGADILITVLPPWWRTWWAYTAYLLTAAMIVGVVYSARRQKIKASRRAERRIRQSQERLQLSLWGSGDEFWDWEIPEDRITRSNSWGLEFPEDGIRNGDKNAEGNIHPRDLPVMRQALQECLAGSRKHYEATYRVKDKFGHWVWVLDRGKVFSQDERGNPMRMAGTLKNINSLKQTENRLRLIAQTFENINDAVWVLDRQLRFVVVNKAFTRTTGYSEKSVIGRSAHLEDDQEIRDLVPREALQQALKDGSWFGELWAQRRQGERYPMQLSIDALRDEEGQITHLVGAFSDITYRKKAEEELSRMARFDPLTKLANRLLFTERVKQAIAASERHGANHAVLYLDLDNFKKVNDSLGHRVGDNLLRHVAQMLRNHVRTDDTLARFSGDEFAVLMENVLDWHMPANVAQKILDFLSSPIKLQGHDVVISASIGVVIYPDDGKEAEDLLRNADVAMYYAKSKGRNNYQFFTESMNQQALQRLKLEAELRQAIDQDELLLHYQPKVSYQTGQIVGMEALVRWQSPERGMVSPGLFIPLAEETGLIVQIGEVILRKACEQARQWKEAGVYDQRIAVNLSALQFKQEVLVRRIKDILQETGVGPESLELEITEGMVMHNTVKAIEQMKQIRDAGITLAIDDFGTGYSSLSHLKNFPLDVLKIDRAFVIDMTENERGHAMVASIVSMAQHLNLKIVTEGVETEEQMRMLKDLNCEQLQGFLFSPPVMPDRMAAMLTEQTNLYDVVASRKTQRLASQ